MNLSNAIAALLVATRADGRAASTVESYRRKLQRLLDHLGDVPVQSITLQDLRGYVAHLMNIDARWVSHPHHKSQPGGLSEFTVASYVNHTKRLFAWLTEEEIIERNPARRLKRLRPRRDTPKAISRVDMVRILNTTAGGRRFDLRDRAIILLLADTGCRVGGLCGLQIDDVLFDRQLVRLREKGDQTRFAPFMPITARAISAWLQERPSDRGPSLFVSLRGRSRGRLSINGVEQMLKRRGTTAGCSGPVNPHAFRHAFAREYLLQGGDLASLSRLMGHASVEVTASYYAVFLIEELQAMHARYSPVVGLEIEGNE